MDSIDPVPLAENLVLPPSARSCPRASTPPSCCARTGDRCLRRAPASVACVRLAVSSTTSWARIPRRTSCRRPCPASWLRTRWSLVGGWLDVSPVGAAQPPRCPSRASTRSRPVRADFVVAGTIDDIQVEVDRGLRRDERDGEDSNEGASKNKHLLARLACANDRRRGAASRRRAAACCLTRGLGGPRDGPAVPGGRRTRADVQRRRAPRSAPVWAPSRWHAAGVIGHRSWPPEALGVDRRCGAVSSTTSTNANDPNESDLHRVGMALGRTVTRCWSSRRGPHGSRGRRLRVGVRHHRRVPHGSLIPRERRTGLPLTTRWSSDPLVWLRSSLNLSSRGPVRAARSRPRSARPSPASWRWISPAAFEGQSWARGRLQAPRAGAQRQGRRHATASVTSRWACYARCSPRWRVAVARRPAANAAGDARGGAAILLVRRHAWARTATHHLPERQVSDTRTRR